MGTGTRDGNSLRRGQARLPRSNVAAVAPRFVAAAAAGAVDEDDAENRCEEEENACCSECSKKLEFVCGKLLAADGNDQAIT